MKIKWCRPTYICKSNNNAKSSCSKYRNLFWTKFRNIFWKDPMLKFLFPRYINFNKCFIVVTLFSTSYPNQSPFVSSIHHPSFVCKEITHDVTIAVSTCWIISVDCGVVWVEAKLARGPVTRAARVSLHLKLWAPISTFFYKKFLNLKQIS